MAEPIDNRLSLALFKFAKELFWTEDVTKKFFFWRKRCEYSKIFKDYFCIKSTLIKYQIDTFDTFVVTALAENITMIVTS